MSTMICIPAETASVALHALLVHAAGLSLEAAAYSQTPGVRRLVASDRHEEAKRHTLVLSQAIQAAATPVPALAPVPAVVTPALPGGSSESPRALTGSGLHQELRGIQSLILSAQTTMSVDDYGDALRGAQQRLQVLMDKLDHGGQAEA